MTVTTLGTTSFLHINRIAEDIGLPVESHKQLICLASGDSEKVEEILTDKTLTTNKKIQERWASWGLDDIPRNQERIIPNTCEELGRFLPPVMFIEYGIGALLSTETDPKLPHLDSPETLEIVECVYRAMNEGEVGTESSSLPSLVCSGEFVLTGVQLASLLNKLGLPSLSDDYTTPTYRMELTGFLMKTKQWLIARGVNFN